VERVSHDHTISPWSALAVQTVAGVASASALPHLPTWLVSACAALFVGALLRLFDPTLRLLGDRGARRFADPPTAPLSRAVLVVDDHEPTRTLLSQLLREKLGVEVLTASNGAEARAAFSARRPRVVIADLMLPDELGDDVLASLPRRVRTLLISGAAEPHALEASAEACGAVAMHKPVEPAAVIATVRGWLAP